MKIVHVSFSGSKKGAAVAALRLHKEMLSAGGISELWCAREPSSADGVRCLKPWFFRKLDSFKCIISQWVGLRMQYDSLRSFNIVPSMLVHQLNRSDADVVHLHWVNAEMISIFQLAKITKPVVWTFHDMWPFCGAEHYTNDNRYVTGYQSSEFISQSLGFSSDGPSTDNRQLPTSNRRPLVDLDRWTFLRKQKHWKNWRPHVVCVSNWLADCVRQSTLMKCFQVEVIPNCLDLEIFKPMDKVTCRRRFNLPLSKKLILFGAADPFDPRKGGDLLASVLSKHRIVDAELVVFGADYGDQIAGLPTHWMGLIHHEADMAQLYNACDVVCVPSRMETFGQTASEPLACGVPVVAFGATGLCEVVDHKVNGYLARPYDTDDFARGIDWVLEESARECASLGAEVFENGEGIRTFGNSTSGQLNEFSLSVAARKKAQQSFDGRKVVAQYMEVYRKALDRAILDIS